MSAYLISNKKIKFSLVRKATPNNLVVTRVGKFELELSRNTLTKHSDAAPSDNGYQHWLVYNKLLELFEDDSKKSLSISLLDIENRNEKTTNPSIQVTLKSQFFESIRNELGRDAKIKLEILKESATPIFHFMGKENKSNENTKSVETNTLPDFGDLKLTEFPKSFAKLPPNQEFSFTKPNPTLDASSVLSNEMLINQIGNEAGGKMRCPSNWQKHWRKVNTDNTTEFHAEVNILVMVSEVSLTEHTRARGLMALNKMLLENAVNADATMIFEGGKVVRCHSDILCVQSRVFQLMLKMGKQFKMECVNEHDGKHFLAYLYHRDLSGPIKDASVTVKLLKLAHQYKTGDLITDMRNILLEKSSTWFDANSAVILFEFANGLEEYSSLKLKAVKVLKEKSQEVVLCDEYNKLFKVEDTGSSKKNSCSVHHNVKKQFNLVKDLCDALLHFPDDNANPSNTLSPLLQGEQLCSKLEQVATEDRESSKKIPQKK